MSAHAREPGAATGPTHRAALSSAHSVAADDTALDQVAPGPAEPPSALAVDIRSDGVDEPVGAHIPLIVADLTLATRLAYRFDQRGNTVKVAPTARAAESLLDRSPFDAVVIDLDTDGFSAHRLVRQLPAPSGPAAVLLRSGAEPTERVRWLKAGASDFVPSPIAADEVVARVEVVLRRRPPVEDAPWTTMVGTVRVNDTTGEVEVDGRRHRLSPMEHKLLRHLASAPGTVFTRQELLRDVWGYTTGSDATVAVHIRKLREKIERNGDRPRLVRTRRGIGYYLSLPPTG